MSDDLTQYDIKIKISESGANQTEKKVKGLESTIDKLKSSVKALGIGVALKKITDSVGEMISKTADYIETINLFRSSMGSAANDAQKFIDKAESLLGLDPSNLMDSISSFQNLSESLGIGSDRAYIMSKNLTQLSGDLSSFANISFEDAQKKLLSGFSGQVQPLRKYGIALDQASLQETAYSLGLQQKVKDMTRAQKTELIYYQIMKSTQKMQGDLGRSLLSPSNALRVMKVEFQRLARAVGSIFIPIMMKIIPVIRAVTQILTEAAQAIAKFFGFELSDYNSDISSIGALLEGVSDDIGSIGDEAEDTTGKLNKMLMPFDELNNITSSTGSGGSGTGLGDIGGGAGLGIELPEYDMFETATTGMIEKINKIKNLIKELLPIIGTIGSALNAWKIGNKVIDALDKIFKISDETKKSSMKILLGITLLISGVKIVFGSIQKMLEGDLSVQNLLIGLFGAGAAGVGGGLIASGAGLASAGPIGWTIGIILGLAVLGVWVYKTNEDLHKKIAEAQGLDYDGMNIIDKLKFQFITKLEIFGLKEHEGDDPWGKAIDDFHKDFKKRIDGVFDSIQKFFSEKIPETINHSGYLIGTALGTIVRVFKEFFENLPKKLDNFFRDVGDFFKNLPENIWKLFSEDIPRTLKNFEEFGKKSVEGLWNGLKNGWYWLTDRVDEWIENFISGFKDGLGIHSPSTIFAEIGENLVQGLINGISNIWSSLVQKFDDIKNLVNFDWSLPKLKTPHMYWTTMPAPNWAANILKALSLPTNVPKLNVEWYAQGGFPTNGQLFIANEAGPELVGNIGSRTAVANQNQIVAAVSKGVYDAMVSAMSNSNLSNNPYIVVNVGDEQMYRGYGTYKNQQSNMYGVNVG